MQSELKHQLSFERRWLLVILAVVATTTLIVAGTVVGRGALPVAFALPCPDGSNTCGPTAPTLDPGPTGNQGPGTTAPQAPTTLAPTADNPAPTAPQQNGGPEFQGTVMPQPTVTQEPDTCIVNCPTQQAPTQAPTTGQAPTETTPSTRSDAPTPSSEPDSSDNFARQCAEAAAQIASFTPAALVSGGGRSRFVALPRDPRPVSACEDCINKTVDNTLKFAKDVTNVDCQRTGPAVFDATVFGKLLSNTTYLGTDTTGWSATVTKTQIGAQWTISNATGGKINGGVEFGLDGLAKGSVGGEVSDTLTVTRTGPRMDTADASSLSGLRDPTKLFPGVPSSEYSRYEVGIVPVMNRYKVPVSCAGKPLTYIVDDMRQVVVAAFPPGGGAPTILTTLAS